MVTYLFPGGSNRLLAINNSHGREALLLGDWGAAANSGSWEGLLATTEEITASLFVHLTLLFSSGVDWNFKAYLFTLLRPTSLTRYMIQR